MSNPTITLLDGPLPLLLGYFGILLAGLRLWSQPSLRWLKKWRLSGRLSVRTLRVQERNDPLWPVLFVLACFIVFVLVASR